MKAFRPGTGARRYHPPAIIVTPKTGLCAYRKAGWGAHAARVRAADSTWAKPRSWDRKAERAGRRLFVFIAHYADVFDNRAPAEWRADVWQLIAATPNLTWLLLSKRPQNFRRMLPADWSDGYPNVWLGVTAENQREAVRRLPLLCRTPAVRCFVSAEPLFEAVDLRPWFGPVTWVIAGCESRGISGHPSGSPNIPCRLSTNET